MNPNLIYSRISQQNLESAWIDAMPWIQKAVGEIAHVHEELRHIQNGLKQGFYQLWAIQDKEQENRPICFLITEQHAVEDFRTLIIRWLAGVQMSKWLKDIRILEEIAVREGFHKIEVWGLPGWERALKPYGFYKEFIILGKVLLRGIN